MSGAVLARSSVATGVAAREGAVAAAVAMGVDDRAGPAVTVALGEGCSPPPPQLKDKASREILAAATAALAHQFHVIGARPFSYMRRPTAKTMRGAGRGVNAALSQLSAD